MLDYSPARHWLIVVVACATLGALWPIADRATAQSSSAAGQTPARIGAGQYHFEDTATHVHILGAARISGDEDQVAVTLRIDAGFHINANPASDDFLIPTTLTIAELAPLRVAYPEAVRFKPKFADNSIDVYDGTILITAFFQKGTLNPFASLHGSVTAQACTDRICLPPAELPLTED